MKKADITLLNAMADKDFETSLARQREWGVDLLDLKDSIYGKALLDLSDAEAEKAADTIRRNGQSVYCFSSTLFFNDIEAGEESFLKDLSSLDRILELARIMKPKVVRLLAAKTSKRQQHIDVMPHIEKNAPWLISAYQKAIDKIAAAGFPSTIENEANGCILSRPEEIRGFFKALDRKGKVSLTLDIQNLWQMGTYPSLEVYEMLSDLTSYFHLKGSRSLVEGGPTHFGCALEDSSWRLLEMTRMAVESGAVVCLNPVKGERIDGYDYSDITHRDLVFLQKKL